VRSPNVDIAHSSLVDEFSHRIMRSPDVDIAHSSLVDEFSYRIVSSSNVDIIYSTLVDETMHLPVGAIVRSAGAEENHHLGSIFYVDDSLILNSFWLANIGNAAMFAIFVNFVIVAEGVLNNKLKSDSS
jgi:hypothetical protein